MSLSAAKHTTQHPNSFTRKVNFPPVNKAKIFSGLILCGASVRTFEILNLKIEKELVSKLTVLFLEVVFIARDERYEFLFFIKR